MTFLRVGAACAVIDDDNRMLLSRRGDMDVWNLPTGRMDSGELLMDCAAREALEETGVVADVQRPLGLYYFEATHRVNVLYRAKPVGGAVAASTSESTGNRYFTQDDLPSPLFADYMANDAFTGRTTLHIYTTPTLEKVGLSLKLGRRWLVNWLRGRPEPRHVRFDVRAVAVLWDAAYENVLVFRDEMCHISVVCSGQRAPWTELEQTLKRYIHADVTLRWVGIWQQPQSNRLVLVFAAVAHLKHIPDQLRWVSVNDTSISHPDAQFVKAIRPADNTVAVWTLIDGERVQRDRV